MMPLKGKPPTSACGSDAMEAISHLKDEISVLSSRLSDKLVQLEGAIHQVREGQNDIVRSISFLDEKYEEMKEKTQKLERENKELKVANRALEEKMTNMAQQVLDLDQYHRRVNLELAGVPEEKEEKAEEIALAIAKKVAPTVTAADIDIAHRLGARKPNQRPRPIIVRFTNRRARNAVYDGRKKLKGTTSKDLGLSQRSNNRIFINENLVNSTKELLGMVNVARKEAGYRFLWTHNGRIYVKKNEKEAPITVHSKEDLAKLV